MYESVALAVRRVINEKDTDILKSENIVKSRMQIKVNFPEVNPAFDTYRIGTVLEMVSTAFEISYVMCSFAMLLLLSIIAEICI